MAEEQLSYVLFAGAALLTVLVIGYDSRVHRIATSRRFWHCCGVLFIFWFIVDQVAIELALWHYPARGTIPIRILRIPLEEYVLFVIHTILTLILVLLCPEAPEQ